MRAYYILVCILITVSACSDYAEKNVAKMLQSDTTIFTQEGKNVTINYTDSGHLKAKIFAKQLIGFKKDGQDIVRMPQGISGNFYNDSGAIESYLTAEKGISYQTQKIMEVTQNVQVMNNKGEKLNTEKLIWDQKKQIIYTDKFVRITTKKEILTGDGLTTKQDFSNMQILKPRGTIQLDQDTLSSKK
jgi:LPS export ABC transporter protein LptC